MYTEASKNLTSAIGADIAIKNEADAISERIQEWFETPAGTIADLPHWGHNLSSFQHDSGFNEMAIGIELSIVEKLPIDVDGVVLRGVGVEEVAIDAYRIYIIHQLGMTVAELNLS
jgi:hypothetical protein